MNLINLINGGLSVIQSNIDNGWITKRKHPQLDLWILNYTHKTQIEWNWNQVTVNCRGLIVDKDWNIITRPFKKFFTLDQWQTIKNNVWYLYGTKYKEMLNGPFEITNKYDGSMCVIFLNPKSNKFECATRGSFESEQAIKATEILQKKYPNSHYINGLTYICEIIYPENQIVVNYGKKADIILLGIVENETGKEINVFSNHAAVNPKFFDLPIAQKYTFDDWQDLDKLNWKNAEGFVVRFLDNDIRVKIKFDEYKSLAKILSSLDEKLVLEWTRNNYDCKSVIEQLQQDKREWVSCLRNGFIQKYYDIENECLDLIKRDGSLHRKEFAYLHKDKYFSSALFAMLDKKDYKNVIWKVIERCTIKNS